MTLKQDHYFLTAQVNQFHKCKLYAKTRTMEERTVIIRHLKPV